MAITKQTITTVTITCDQCGNAVGKHTPFLSISDHGLAFHLSCFTGMTPMELMRHMGHDDSVIHTTTNDGGVLEDGLRLRDPRALKLDGTIDHTYSTERVQWPL